MEIGVDGPQVNSKDVNRSIVDVLWKKYPKLLANTSAGILALGMEVARWASFNQFGRERFNVITPLPSRLPLEVVQSLGDAGPGFFVSAIAYEAMDILSAPLEAKGVVIPDEVKVGAAVLLGMGAIAAHEGGKFMAGSQSTGSITDIIGGSVGPIAFIGFKMLLDRVVNRIDKRVKDLENLPPEISIAEPQSLQVVVSQNENIGNK